MLLAYDFLFVFAVGAAIGSFLNVCLSRLPWEKSVFWPSSRCGHCLQPIRLADNLPLISYWVLRGRCRTCGQPFSVRYFVVELVTALAFVGVFYLGVYKNVLGLPVLAQRQIDIRHGAIPLVGWAVFVHQATLVGYLLLTSLCDLSDMEIPLSITLTGTVVGLVFAVCFPWPFPSTHIVRPFQIGLYPWPVWQPLPAWLPPGSWRLGLATGLAGALAGMLTLRGVRFLFGVGRGLEGLGMGDADFMMMAGSFLGWQPVVLAFFISAFPGLVFGIVQLARTGDRHMPFVPPLAIGVLLTLYGWARIGPGLHLFFFQPVLLLLVGGSGAFLLLIAAFLLRLLRGSAEAGDEQPAVGSKESTAGQHRPGGMGP